MGHSTVPLAFTYKSTKGDKHKTSCLQPYSPNETLNNALGAIRVLGLERIEDELKPHLCTVLVNIRERKKGTAEQVVISGILPVLALLLRCRGPLAQLTAQLVAELAKESMIRKGFGDAGLVTALLSVLTSADQDLLEHAVQAIARVSYDSCKHQQLLLRKGVVPRLVAVLLRFPGNGALEEVCLRALCNLSGVSVAEEAGVVWERGAPTQPGQSTFRGVAPRKCGLVTSVTMVRVCRWAPAQYAVSVELVQRCSASFLNLHRRKGPAGCFPFLSFGRRSKMPSRNSPRRSSLKTLVFHTFL
ncbi:rap1 GTPase-GDP dissociation stimulator 1 [Syngnathoides biaculeatus]|uniref:rap1 GTPase-GDP dissociation stimulator 1 n=1 Tax=Syngnathoides biaculeatus TaxID=300417 RepID=UPI002ADDF1F4|nr:rap1 GTPase-GDP dissociation stimulator 1 [Syngnathoides biaculeatus]